MSNDEPKLPEAGAEGVISDVLAGNMIDEDLPPGEYLVISERGVSGAYIAANLTAKGYLDYL